MTTTTKTIGLNVTVETNHDELVWQCDQLRRRIGTRVARADRMRRGTVKTAYIAETAILRTRWTEMWNASAQAQMVEVAPNHWACREDATCEALSIVALEMFRARGWLV